MKKKAISLLLAVVLLLSFSLTALADDDVGDPNLEGGGGGMGSGTSDNKWVPGMEGVRVSIVDVDTGSTVGTPIDYSNAAPTLAFHFGKKSKLQYKNGTSLSPTTSTYKCNKPSPALPAIIKTSSNGANIEAIKRYFCSEYVTNMIASDFGITFEKLTSGKYKLLLEPIAYVVYDGNYIGFTAHECAMYDQQLSGGIRSKLASLSHQNLPLAMYLEHSDLGFSAYSGASSGKQNNDTILAYLGIGTVSYTDEPPPDPISTDVEYRTNTEVITAVTLNAGKRIFRTA